MPIDMLVVKLALAPFVLFIIILGVFFFLKSRR